MPGPYAHITLLHELIRPASLKSTFSASSGFNTALRTYFPYCVLGAVSPDYPNLARGSDAAKWADAMHYTRACEMITSGIELVREARGVARHKQLAWLLGYIAHVATDATIHPIVQEKVGIYAENQRQHRICEMNQDSYIYRRMNLGEIGESDVFARTIVQCCDPENESKLDPDIVSLWEGMLADVHPDLFDTNPPDSASWHHEFISRVFECSLKKVQLFPLAANISAKMALTYPEYDKVDHQFIEEQVVPKESPICLHFDTIFDRAVSNTGVMWRLVEQAVCAYNQASSPRFGDWNLDNGRDEHGRLVLW